MVAVSVIWVKVYNTCNGFVDSLPVKPCWDNIYSMQLVNCQVSLSMAVMLKKQRRKKPWKVKGGPKPTVQLLAGGGGVTSVVPPPAQPGAVEGGTKTHSSTAGGGVSHLWCRPQPSQGGGGGNKTGGSTTSGSPVWNPDPDFPIQDRQKGCYIPVWFSDDWTPVTGPQPLSSGPSGPHLSAPVKLSFVAPVEQVALKMKATSPLMPQQSERRRPTSPTTLPHRECAQSRIKRWYRNFITPPLEKNLWLAPWATAAAAAPKGNGHD